MLSVSLLGHVLVMAKYDAKSYMVGEGIKFAKLDPETEERLKFDN